MEIRAVVAGERDIAARLEQLPQKLRARLEQRIGGLTRSLADRVRGAEPQRTGKLRGETHDSVRATDELVLGKVFVSADSSSDHAKAGALEYGAHSSVKVRSYQRAGHNPQGERAEQIVAAYTRQANILARRFERGSLEGMRGQIESELRAAIAEAV